MAKTNETKTKTKIRESAMHYGLKKKVKIFFQDSTSIEGVLDFINTYEYVLINASKKVKENGEIIKKPFKNEVVVLKSAVKYLTVIE